PDPPNPRGTPETPLPAVYGVPLSPASARPAATWRRICREEGLGEIYLAMVESFELVSRPLQPAGFGCDAAIEFPPQGMAEPRPPSGPATNSRFAGGGGRLPRPSSQVLSTGSARLYPLSRPDPRLDHHRPPPGPPLPLP